MVETKNLTRYYGKNKNVVKALDGVDFVLPDKGLVFIVGKSGSGKSTLLNLLCGLDDATSGSIFVNGEDICALKPHELDNYRNYFVGIIYQHFNLFEEDSVINNIKIASDIAENKVSDDDIVKIIEKLDLKGKEKSLVRELSGGQKQRVAIARALIKNPHMIVADEPTGNLDSRTSKLIFDVFREISKEKLVVIVSHDMENAKLYADRLIEIADGKIISDCERNADYDAECKNVILSSSAELSTEELDAINVAIKDKGLKVSTSDEQFVKFEKEVATNENKANFKGHNRSWRNAFRLSLKFLSSAWLSLVVAVLLSSMIIGLLVLSSEFSNFDGQNAMQTVVDQYGFDCAVYNKGYSYTDSTLNVNSDYIVGVTDDDVKKFRDAGYTGNIYPIYSTPIYNGSYNLEKSHTNSDSQIKNIYIEECYGTMVTDLAHLNRIFGGVEVIAGSLYNAESSVSVIITDYFADALLALGNAQRADGLPIYSFDGNDIYQNLLGSKLADRYTIGAIIKTDYKEKYKAIFAMYQKLQLEKQNADVIAKELYSSNLYSKFTEDVKSILGMTYSLNPDFINDFCTSPFGCRHFHCQGVSVYDESDELVEAYSSDSHVYIDEALPEGEFLVSNTVFSKLFNGATYSDDEDFYLTFKQYGIEQNSHELPKLEKKLKVCGTFESSAPEILFFKMSRKDASEFMLNTYQVYALCFDDISQLTTIHDVASNNFFYTGSSAFTAIVNIINIVGIFSEIFKYIAIALIFVVGLFIVFYNLRIIRKNQYRLGVYKSLGYSSVALGESTLINSIYLILAIFVLSVLIAFVFSTVANGILSMAFATFLNNELYSNLVLVEFSMPLLLKYVGIVFGLTLATTVIPVIAIRNIKPNIIINKAE